MNTGTNHDPLTHKLGFSLLLLRIGITIVFMMWTIDKFLNPDHAASVFERYYSIPWLSTNGAYGAYIVGGLQLGLVLAFLFGLFRTYSYGLIVILHTVSTVTPVAKYLDPWSPPNLLFYAAFPMLAACLVVWMLREYDIYSLDHYRADKTHKV